MTSNYFNLRIEHIIPAPHLKYRLVRGTPIDRIPIFLGRDWDEYFWKYLDTHG